MDGEEESGGASSLLWTILWSTLSSVFSCVLDQEANLLIAASQISF